MFEDFLYASRVERWIKVDIHPEGHRPDPMHDIYNPTPVVRESRVHHYHQIKPESPLWHPCACSADRKVTTNQGDDTEWSLYWQHHSHMGATSTSGEVKLVNSGIFPLIERLFR